MEPVQKQFEFEIFVTKKEERFGSLVETYGKLMS